MGGLKRGGGILVLAAQHRAGDIGDATTDLHQLGGLRHDAGLQGMQTLDLFLGQTPRVLGVATPRARARARRIDQNQIGFVVQVFQTTAVLADQDQFGLDARTLQTRTDVFQTLGDHVRGDQTALPHHRLGQTQRLSATTGAIVNDGRARLGVGQRADDLAAFVLNLETAFLEAFQRLNVGRRLGRQTQAQFRPRRFFRRQFGGAKLALNVLAGGLQAVDAQVDRRARGHQVVGLGLPVVTIDLLEVGHHKLGDAGGNPARQFAIGGGDAAALLLGQRSRAIAVASVQGLDLFQRQVVQRVQAADDQCAAILAAPHDPAQAATGAQHLIDAVGDGAAIFRSGIAVLLTPCLQHDLGGLAALRDGVEDGGGGGETGGWGQWTSVQINGAASTMTSPASETSHTSDRIKGMPKA